MKIRNAAIAATAALALTFSGTAVAGAQETEKTFSSSDSIGTALSSGNSSAVGDATDADDRANGEDILGDEKDENAPVWAQQWVQLAELAGVGILVGGIIGAVNFWQYISATGF